MKKGISQSGKRWLALFAAVIGADLGSKWVATLIAGAGDIGLITPRRNPDFALGILVTDSHPAVLVLLASSTVLLLLHAAKLTTRGVLPIWVTAALAAGAVANGVDRVATGAVHDWLYLGYVVANLADFALVAGLGMYLVTAWVDAGHSDEAKDPAVCEAAL